MKVQPLEWNDQNSGQLNGMTETAKKIGFQFRWRCQIFPPPHRPNRTNIFIYLCICLFIYLLIHSCLIIKHLRVSNLVVSLSSTLCATLLSCLLFYDPIIFSLILASFTPLASSHSENNLATYSIVKITTLHSLNFQNSTFTIWCRKILRYFQSTEK